MLSVTAMDKRTRKERNVSSSESHHEDTEKVSTKPATSVKEEGRREKPSRGKQRRDSDGFSTHHGQPKHSRIRELLSSVQDDVVQMQESDTGSREVATDIIPLPTPDQIEYSRQFTRISPHKLSPKHSKWKKAVRLSKSVMSINRRQAAGVAEDVEKATHEQGRTASGKALGGFLRCLDHGSCIASGILVGLLLWSTLNIVSWRDRPKESVYGDNYIKVYYTTTVILTYVTLIGFLIRIYSSWSKFSGMLIVYVAAFLSVLIFHYLTKGFSLLQLECQVFSKLDDDVKIALSAPHSHHCHVSKQEGSTNLSQEELIFLIISNSIQTVGALIIALYFHFTTFAESWFVSSGYKIESRSRTVRS